MRLLSSSRCPTKMLCDARRTEIEKIRSLKVTCLSGSSALDCRAKMNYLQGSISLCNSLPRTPLFSSEPYFQLGKPVRILIGNHRLRRDGNMSKSSRGVKLWSAVGFAMLVDRLTSLNGLAFLLVAFEAGLRSH